MTSKELLNLIISEIEKLGIELKTGNLVGASAYISPKAGWGVWDDSRANLFDLCHEYMHARYGDTVRCSDNDCDNPCEKRANKGAILFLWKVFEQNGRTTDDLIHFIQITGCPEMLTKIVILRSKIKDWSREEIHSQVGTYLDHSDDEPENWDLYRIMDSCRIDYKWEFLVENLIREYHAKYFQNKKI